MNKFILFKGTVFLLALLVSQSVSAQVENRASLSNDLGMEFIRIESGSMIVGKLDLHCPNPPDTRNVDPEAKWTAEDFRKCEELTRLHSREGFKVAFKTPYYIGKFEVTQQQWEAVMNNNPSVFQGDKIGNSTSDFPVESVTWEEVKGFIEELNAMDTAVSYRLPTEFEWEYAARAGETELLSWAATRRMAWIQRTDKGSPQRVGLMEPNAWGLYDMLGNVWEWVEDFYNDELFADPTPPSVGTHHVLKGGSFTSDVANAHYFFHGAGPGNGFDVGFRLVMEIK
jgi:sulfatase modifying factor 1